MSGEALGVLGGGQLGRMLALAARAMGVPTRLFDPAPDACAKGAGEVVTAAYEDWAAIERFASGLRAATYEFENVPPEAVERLGALVEVRPGAASLVAASDRAAEREALVSAGFGVAKHRVLAEGVQLEEAAAEVGLPGVLKLRRGGYDGKGQVVVRERSELQEAEAWRGGRGAIFEELIPFTRELSIVGVRGGVRGADGACRFFPITENVHREGILLTSIAPAPGVSAEAEASARAHATRLMENLGHVGVLAVELFETVDGMIANEFAPRVHNTGHWTMDGAACGQFEQHVRAVLGLPLGETGALGHAGMVNLVGCLPDIGRVLGVPGTTVHLYEKAARPGRKLGHVNVLAATPEARDERVAAVLSLLPAGALGGLA